MIICDHCKGNGYVKIRFEAEEAERLKLLQATEAKRAAELAAK